jgi:hypothetical protein
MAGTPDGHAHAHGHEAEGPTMKFVVETSVASPPAW